MDKDLYIKLLEKEIWGTCNKVNAPLPDGDPQLLRQDIQDLKLENDRLNRREKLYQEFLNFIDCYDRICIRCTQYRPDDEVHCKMAFRANRHELCNELKQRLEEL